MKKIILLLFITCSLFGAKAQNKVDNLFFEARGGFMNALDDGKYNGYFTGDFFNLQMFGHINDKISYRIRQRLNKNPFAQDNIFNATDFLYFSWNIDDTWFLDFGKQEIYIGGFEYDYAPIDNYYWSDFCNQLPKSYGMGITLGYKQDENNKVMLQIANSPFYMNPNDKHFSYNLIWFGQVFPWWKTMWSVNFVDVSDDINMFYVALGNRFKWNNWYLELDYTNSMDNDDNYGMSICAKLNYNYKDMFNFFVKGGYDDHSYVNIEDINNIFVFNSTYKYIGCGVEYFPLDNKDLRLHAVYYHDNRDNENRLTIGATWKLNVINNK
ncbi:MAG: hypothetical protein IJ180_11410 [Bacteroidales bacterium]|nr:hypothetical protein [Bacteroidales bacterium]MBQ9255364.1 hypothetical protein [Bacteroidales bacterium]